MKHLLFTIYGANSDKLNDINFVEQSLREFSDSIGATLLNVAMHQFDPQGVTGVVLLAESHISIHTWPENQVAVCDVFTCSNISGEELWNKTREFASKFEYQYLANEGQIDREFEKIVRSQSETQE